MQLVSMACKIRSSLSETGCSLWQFLSCLSIKCNKMSVILYIHKNAKDPVSKVRGQAISFYLPPAPQGVLTCIEVRLWVPTGVPWVQVEVRQRTFPSLRLSVVFLATWRLEAAALIETHPSPSTSSSGSLSLFQNSLFHHRERKGRTEGEREGWRSEEKEDEGRTCTGTWAGERRGREDRSYNRENCRGEKEGDGGRSETEWENGRWEDEEESEGWGWKKGKFKWNKKREKEILRKAEGYRRLSVLHALWREY